MVKEAMSSHANASQKPDSHQSVQDHEGCQLQRHCSPHDGARWHKDGVAEVS